ncbi:hypothetical protein IFM89_035341 [Coptis chinensis]|uniref:Uncharacterized protein n=1 Tax=Coptis chinensis TaxID=261450 RepID=A0A835H179_9MAGN|nr:hypothetical protein IFM89_035341 [Coptis chinensis]
MTLVQSKEVISNIVNVVNTAIYSYANTNPSPWAINYYNQSGSLIPPLCSPFDSELNDRQCGPQEVSFSNALSVWQNYTCVTSSSGFCTTVGRITPDFYTQTITSITSPTLGTLPSDGGCWSGTHFCRCHALPNSLDSVCKPPPKGGSVCEAILTNKWSRQRTTSIVAAIINYPHRVGT